MNRTPFAVLACLLVVIGSVGVGGVSGADSATVASTPTATPTSTAPVTTTTTTTTAVTVTTTTTATATETQTAMETSTPSSTPTITVTATETETPARTKSPSTATPSPTPPSTPTPTPTASPPSTPTPTPTASPTSTLTAPEGVVAENGTLTFREDRTGVGAPGVDVRAPAVTVDGAGRRLSGSWVSVGTGVEATNDSVDSLVVSDLALSQWQTGIAVANASTLRVENATVGTTARSVVAENLSAVTVEDTRLTASTGGAFHDAGTVRLRNVTGGRLVFDGGTRVEASNVSLSRKRAVDFAGRNVTVDEAVDVPRPPPNHTRAGPALAVSKAGANATVTVELPARAPPGTPNTTLSVWRYDGNWSELRTTRTDGRLVATLSPDDGSATVVALGAAEPRLVTARSADVLSTTVGNETTLDVTFRNTGTEAFPLANVTVRGPNASRFSVVDGGLGARTAEQTATTTPQPTPAPTPTPTASKGASETTASKGALQSPEAPHSMRIRPGASHRVTIAFVPESPGIAHATLVFDRANHTDVVTVDLVGTAAAPGTSVHVVDGTDTDADDPCEVDDGDEVVIDEYGRRVLRVSDNLSCVLDPRERDSDDSREEPSKPTTTAAPPVVGVPNTTATPTQTSTPTRTATLTRTAVTAMPTATPPERSTPADESTTAASTPSTPGQSPRPLTDVPPPTVTADESTVETTTPVTTPGFGVLPVVAAVAALALAVRRACRGRP